MIKYTEEWAERQQKNIMYWSGKYSKSKKWQKRKDKFNLFVTSLKRTDLQIK